MAASNNALYERPEWVQHMIAMGDAAGGPEKLVPLDVEQLCDIACSATGLDDFGDWDGDWRARLHSLVENIEATGELHSLGRLMTRAEIQRGLISRLRIREDIKQRPGIEAETVESPVIITGPARSGTSLTLELLDLDPTLQGPRGDQITHPGNNYPIDPQEKLRRARFEYEFWMDVQPEFKAVHELVAHYPQECIHLQIPSFAGFFWPMIANIPNWDMSPEDAMQFHKLMLKTMQHEAGVNSWVLKTPIYLAIMPLLFATYPDAWVIHNHRDPVKITASGASTLATVRWLRSDAVDLKHIAASDAMGFLLLMVMEQRLKGEIPDRIVDVHFADLMKDPVATIEAAYATMGRTFHGEHADAIRKYVDNRPKGKFGKHAYSTEQFGFDENEIRERMKPYTDHYGIALETA